MTNRSEQSVVLVDDEASEVLAVALRVLTVPKGYVLARTHLLKQNSSDVWVFRYEKASGENNGFGGEHFSFVLEKSSGKIIGFTWMDQSSSKGQLPSREETLTVAKQFSDRVDPGLFEKLENLWIGQHNETITVKDGTEKKTVTISGMKYKCYRKEEENYTWFVVGPSGQVITFEQGIVWNNGRVTEKWLHDNWAMGHHNLT